MRKITVICSDNVFSEIEKEQLFQLKKGNKKSISKIANEWLEEYCLEYRQI